MPADTPPSNRAARRAHKRGQKHLDQNNPQFPLPQQRVPVVPPRQFAARRRGSV
ncbi:hypothetical protein [Lentzea guizhouensis]|uniref:hypothetical protein n=1 Tax=Lentzea guizhouensis TaxID=1586287 RepID=UPI0012B6806E|nr:hypothetical protein [Lentzea guizhouensis]